VVQEGNNHLFHTLAAALQQSGISCLSLADLGQIFSLAWQSGKAVKAKNRD
jgi:hypothetical protein